LRNRPSPDRAFQDVNIAGLEMLGHHLQKSRLQEKKLETATTRVDGGRESTGAGGRAECLSVWGYLVERVTGRTGREPGTWWSISSGPRLPEIKVYAPEGTYLAWLDCRSLQVEGESCEYSSNRQK